MVIDEDIRKDSGVAVLSIGGDFWGGSEWSLYEKVKELIDRGHSNVVMDLSRVQRINSQGIGVLVSCLTSLRNVDGNMKIAGANRNIVAHLDLLNLYTVVESFPTPDEATASFTPGA
jgi:anti-sigma B factor antagonist